MRVSGHKSESSIRSYSRRLSEVKQKEISLGKLVSFVFPRVLMFPSTSSRKNKIKLFP